MEVIPRRVSIKPLRMPQQRPKPLRRPPRPPRLVLDLLGGRLGALVEKGAGKRLADGGKALADGGGAGGLELGGALCQLGGKFLPGGACGFGWLLLVA
jgi:hypothetical protein